MEKISLTTEQLDALRELGNIGAGNGATALSQLLGRKVYISISRLQFMDLNDVAPTEFINDSNSIGIAFVLKMLGMLKGGILVLFSQDSASLLVDILMRRPPSSTKLFTISDISAIAESSHILSSSYLSAVGEFLGIYQIIPSIPQTIMDRMDRIASILIKNYVGENINYIIPIENQLNIDGVLVKMYVIFVLERESVNKILKIMKMAGI